MTAASSTSPSPSARISPTDRELLRGLAEQVAEIAALPVQEEKRDLWRRLNGLRPARPLVWINEIPWEELACEELTCRAEDEEVRAVERQLRTTLYLWEHMRTDMVVDGTYYVPYAFRDSGYGIEGKTHVSDGGVAGRGCHDYEPIMETDEDIERIRMPVIEADRETTERIRAKVADLLGGVLPVETRGVTTMWCSAWDVLIQWWGIEEFYIDMYDRPEFVNKGVSRMMDAFLARLDQLEAQGLLSAGEYNHRVGSGGLGITDELPQPDFDGRHARPLDQWGTCTGQIFSEVSPEMHWEFCLRHELRWLERFGLNCYGCCEPLHNKMGILREIPRLRRISMSTWVDVEKGAAELGPDYIFSFKPNPAVFAWDHWEPAEAKKQLVDVLERTRGNTVELIMKDITTCRNDPRRLWEWCDMAVRVAEDFAY